MTFIMLMYDEIKMISRYDPVDIFTR